MPTRTTLLIHDGDLAGLTALAMAVDDDTPDRLALWIPRSLRAAEARRRDHAKRQADHFHVEAVFEGTEVEPDPSASRQEVPPPLATPTTLLAAVADAIRRRVTRIIWPITSGGDFDAMALATEQALMARQLAELEGHAPPTIETPLVEVTDRQMIEIAAHLEAPFELAWSCEGDGETPCHDCAGCARRRAAFDAAGMVDPILQPGLR